MVLSGITGIKFALWSFNVQNNSFSVPLLLQIISEGASDAPPSRPGFESDAEKSTQTFSIPFPEVPTPSSTFPATIIQDHAQLDMERFAAGAHVTGLSPRTDNIVRAFQIHGPLDRELLSRALNEVSSLHPLLTATFQRCKSKLYVKTSEGESRFQIFV